MRHLTQFAAVTVGSGVSSLAMAVTLAERGVRVCVCEKMPAIGGTSFNFRGIFAVESDMQRERYITYSRDEAFKNIMEYSHWRANPRLVRAIVDESAKTILWLQEMGVVFYNVTTNIPNAPQTYHLVKNSGEDVIKALSARARQLGVIIKTSTPVKQIIFEDGHLAGVIVQENGEDERIDAGVVMVASGGYANNAEWIKKYCGLDLNINLIPIGNEGKMGDGIRMAHQLGAAEEGIEVLEMLRTGKEKPGSVSQIGYAVVQPDLWINDRGERFCDESVTFDDTSMGNAIIRQKGAGFGYSVFDTNIVRLLMERGIEKAMALDFPPGSRLNDLDKELAAAPVNRPDEVFQADSIYELAIQIKVAPAVLQVTIDEYNRFCDQRHDELFAKNPNYLRPLRGPRFYAVRAQTVFLGTMGGIKINQHIEVVDRSEKAIPGLYAGGFDAGGMYGDSYSIRFSTGLSSSFAVNSGRLAGKSALEYLKIASSV